MSHLAFLRNVASRGTRSLGISALVVTGLLAAARAEVPAGLVLATAGYAQHRDTAFLRDALRHNEISMRAARLAMARSRDLRVRQFADRAQREHAAVLARLNALAAARGVVSDPHQADLESYSGLRGAAFDRKFVDDRIAQARASVVLFTAEAGDGEDRLVAQFAGQTLPMLRRHLAAAEALQAQFELRRRNFSDPAS